MTESDATYVKRYYVAHVVPHEARAALPLLPEAFEHCNEVHPHSTLKHAFVSKVNAAAGYVQGPEASDLFGKFEPSSARAASSSMTSFSKTLLNALDRGR